MARKPTTSPAGQSRLPARFLRTESRYRSAGDRTLGAGFILKPTSAGVYRGRVMSSFVIVYVLRGSGRFVGSDGVEHAVAAGDLLQMPGGQPCSLEQNPDGQWAEAFFALPASIEAAMAAIGAVDLSRPLLRPGVELSVAERFDQIIADLREAADSKQNLVIARMHELLAMLYLLDRRQQERGLHAAVIDEACRRIGDAPERKPDLTPLLRANGLSYERFRKLFRQHTGVSPNGYRIRRRIDAARAMFQQRMSIKEVAYALGYPDRFTFSRQFKQVVGVSPRNFVQP